MVAPVRRVAVAERLLPAAQQTAPAQIFVLPVAGLYLIVRLRCLALTEVCFCQDAVFDDRRDELQIHRATEFRITRASESV